MGERPITLASSDFQLFGLEQRFAQDDTAIDARWKELQREAHPDRFAAQASSEQRLAMQWSVRINEAYRRLKDPVRRATYLCELLDAPINAETNTAMPAEFLMQQMEWRETLDGANSVAELAQLQEQVQQSRDALLQRCAEFLDLHKDPGQAAAQVRSLMFIERFCADIEARLEPLESASGALAGADAAHR